MSKDGGEGREGGDGRFAKFIMHECQVEFRIIVDSGGLSWQNAGRLIGSKDI